MAERNLEVEAVREELRDTLEGARARYAAAESCPDDYRQWTQEMIDELSAAEFELDLAKKAMDSFEEEFGIEPEEGIK